MEKESITLPEKEMTTLVSVASVLGKVLQHYGLEPESIAREAGINTDDISRSQDRLEVSKLQKVWQIALVRTRDECFGLTYAKYIQPAALYGLGLSWIASESLKDAINRLLRFQHAISTALDLKLTQSGNMYFIEINSRLKRPVSVSGDAAIATIYQMCRITFGPDIKPLEVSIAHARPKCSDEFDAFFGVPVKFDADTTRLCFDGDMFESSLASSNPELARINDQVVTEYLQKFDKKNIVAQVRAEIIKQLTNGVPRQEKIAHSLHLSLRNLQRKLKEEGVSYKELLDQIRSELSKQYLRGTDRSIIEVGFLLGFNEPSNFARAFRRWTGRSPQEYRFSH